MREFIDALGGPNTAMSFLVPLSFFLAVGLLIGFVQWRKYRQAELEAGVKQQTLLLKQQMIEKGMSAEEIERVLSAQPATGGSSAETMDLSPHHSAR